MVTTTVIWIGPDGPLAEDIRGVVLSTAGCRLESFARAETAVFRLFADDVGLVLAYLADSRQVPGLVEVLHEIGEARAPVPMIVVTENDDPDLCLEVLRLGAADCLPRPLDLSRLAFLTDILTIRARYAQPEHVRDAAVDSEESRSRVADFLFATPEDHALLGQLRKIAPLESTVLLTGETGTGKTHLAKAIHELSPRKNEPFLEVSCSALPLSLFESELFGHVRGAFTTADRDRAGRFAEAGKGTILLDEVDCVPVEAQPKLLRAVEERVFEPVGSGRSQRFSGRLVAATNRPLEGEVAAGRFRADLYYRLKVVDFSLPPLRDRRELIRPLTEDYLVDRSVRCGRAALKISAAALEALEAFHWPGNVRELRNVIERAAALCPADTIGVGDLPEPIRLGPEHATSSDGPSDSKAFNALDSARREAERGRLVDALRHQKNNRTNAAIELGISRVTLYKKLHQYGLT